METAPGTALRAALTPAAERVLVRAQHWAVASGPAAAQPALLISLLEETECRACRWLESQTLSIRAVRDRWPLVPSLPVPTGAVPLEWEPALQSVLHGAQTHHPFAQRQTELATEDLLVGLLACPGELTDWLAEQGILLLGAQALVAPGRPSSSFELPDPALPAIDLPGESVAVPPFETKPPVPVERNPEPIAPPANLVTAWELAAGRSVPLGVWRVLDAAANRAREALRVIEDFVRFVLDDRQLTTALKQLRHDLVETVEQLPRRERLAARDTLHDVGTTVATRQEQTRQTVEQVLAANFARWSEALRSLEEFSKLAAPGLAGQFEALRYRSYTLERAVATTQQSVAQLANIRLYVLVDGKASPDEFESLVRELVNAGVHVLQLRDKQLADRALLARAKLLRELTTGTETLFIMNDRADLAVLADADGVHVGQAELSVAAARQIVGPTRLVGVSTHNLEQARQAVLDGADYLGIGPTFPSTTKSFTQFAGLDFVREISHEIRLPAFAIGGITAENLPQVLAAGASRVAVSGAIGKAQSPGEAAKELLRLLR